MSPILAAVARAGALQVAMKRGAINAVSTYRRSLRTVRSGAAAAAPAKETWSGAALRLFGGATKSDIRSANGVWEKASLRQSNMALLERLVASASEYSNTFFHTITVGCKGGPGADLRRVYYLACSAAFGRFARNRVEETVNRTFKVHFDVTKKYVEVSLGYSCGIVTATIRDVRNLFGAGFVTPTGLVSQGVDQLTIGGQWSDFLTVASKQGPGTVEFQGGVPNVRAGDQIIAGRIVADVILPRIPNVFALNGIRLWELPVDVYRVTTVTPITVLRPWLYRPAVYDVLREYSEQFAAAPGALQFRMQLIAPEGEPDSQVVSFGANMAITMPDAGRIITSGEVRNPQLQPPRPPLDGVSRGDLISITMQALTNPGQLPDMPLLVNGDRSDVPVVSSGMYVNQQDLPVRPGSKRPLIINPLRVNNSFGKQLPFPPKLEDGPQPVEIGGQP